MKETVFRPVPRCQAVFTVPKMLRIHFRNDRRLLGTSQVQVEREGQPPR